MISVMEKNTKVLLKTMSSHNPSSSCVIDDEIASTVDRNNDLSSLGSTQTHDSFRSDQSNNHEIGYEVVQYASRDYVPRDSFSNVQSYDNGYNEGTISHQGQLLNISVIHNHYSVSDYRTDMNRNVFQLELTNFIQLSRSVTPFNDFESETIRDSEANNFIRLSRSVVPYDLIDNNIETTRGRESLESRGNLVIYVNSDISLSQ